MLRVLQFLILLITRTVLVLAASGALLAAWSFYGYRHIACHPMFQSGNIVCDEVAALAAEHSVALAQAFLPYQQLALDYRAQLVSIAAVTVGFALLVEILIGLFTIMRRKKTLKVIKRSRP